MTQLYRYGADGRYLGFLVQDRPTEAYVDRIGVDLTVEAPPEPPAGSWPFRLGAEWVMQLDPPRPAPPTPTPPPAPTPAPAP